MHVVSQYRGQNHGENASQIDGKVKERKVKPNLRSLTLVELVATKR
jgi:hypothetical protein